MRIAEVWIERPVAQIDQTFTYKAENPDCERGKRILVPFGAQKLVGFVDHVREYDGDENAFEKEFGYPLREIEEVIDETPVLNEELFALGKWLAEDTIAPRIACYQAMLPNKLSPKSSSKNKKMQDWVLYVTEPAEFGPRQIRQKEALEALKKEKNGILRSQWRKEYGVSTKNLEDKGYARIEKREARYEIEETLPVEKALPFTVYRFPARNRAVAASAFSHTAFP